MVTNYNEGDHCHQLKEAASLLSNPPDSVDELLHILDQLERLLTKVDQSHSSIMQEALSQPMKALVDGRLLEHSSMDVKVSVALCLCEITRITAPEAPYSDEEMKAVFQCIVSSLENLSDKSSQSYSKRVSILDIVSRIKSCVIMLDLECDDLIVKLFEHFLNSVRDHHIGDVFSFMVTIMTLVLEESEDISLNILKPLLASVKNNSEGVLPVARKLGEEVIKKSADKLRPYLNKSVTVLGNLLGDYSQVLTSICEGTTDFVEHNESASLQPKVVNTTQATVSLDDAAPVISNGDMVTESAGDIGGGEQIKKTEGDVDHPRSDLTSKLDTDDLVNENSGNVESKHDTTTKSVEPLVSETVHDENIAEKDPEIVVSVQKPIESEVAKAPSQSVSQQEESQSKMQFKKGSRSKKKASSQTDPPSTVAVLTKVKEASDQEMRSPKRTRKKTPKAEDNKPSVTTGSDVEPLKNSGKKVEAGDSGAKPVKRSRKKVGGGGSVAKKPKLSGKKVPESMKPKQDDNKEVEAGDSEVKPAKRSVKKGTETDSAAKILKPSDKKGKKSKVISKPSEEIANKDEETDSDNRPLKLSENKEEETDSNHKSTAPSAKKGKKSKVISKPSEEIANKDKETDSDNKPFKPSENKEKETDSNRKHSAAKPLKPSAKNGKKSKVISKPSEEIANKDEETDSDNKPLKPSENKEKETDSYRKHSAAKPLKPSAKKGKKSKVISKSSEEIANKDEGTDSDNKPLKPSENKEEEIDSNHKPSAAKPLKPSAKKGKKSKVTSKPSEEIANKDEETDSDNKPLKQSENKEKETDSNHKSLNLSEDKDDEETDSDNIPLKLSAKRGNKSSSSVVKSSSTNKDDKKEGLGKSVVEKDQTKSLSEDDDGMDVSLNSVLKKATKTTKGKSNLKAALSAGSKRKRSITKKKVTGVIKYDDSLVGQKVKVWWPEDKMYYEGAVESFDSAEKKHKVLYLDGEEEILNLKTEKWDIIKEFSTPNNEAAVEDQKTEILPEIGGSSAGESKVNKKEVDSTEDNETKKDEKKATPQKIVYSRGKKSKTKSPDDVKESDGGNAAEEPNGEKEKSTEIPKVEKSTETPKVGSKSAKKKRKIN